MATKKKSPKPLKQKKAKGTKANAAKKAVLKKIVKKKVTSKKKPAPKALAKKKPSAAANAPAKRLIAAKVPAAKKGKTRAPRGNRQDVETVSYDAAGKRARSGGQSGDLEGLSDRATADSESVDELVEEGNAFEAEVVMGVEDALDPDQGEVRTHEVPEDDIPEEYGGSE